MASESRGVSTLLYLLIFALGLILGQMAAKPELRSLDLVGVVVTALIGVVNLFLVQRTIQITQDAMSFQRQVEVASMRRIDIREAEQQLLYALRDFGSLVPDLPPILVDRLNQADLQLASLLLFQQEGVAAVVTELKEQAEASPLAHRREDVIAAAQVLLRAAETSGHSIASAVLRNMGHSPADQKP